MLFIHSIQDYLAKSYDSLNYSYQVIVKWSALCSFLTVTGVTWILFIFSWYSERSCKDLGWWISTLRTWKLRQGFNRSEIPQIMSQRFYPCKCSVGSNSLDYAAAPIIRSFPRSDLIKWVEMSVHPSVNILVFFSISFLITEPTVFRLRRMILDMGPHNHSVCFLRPSVTWPEMRSKCLMAFIYFLSYYWAEYFQLRMMIPDMWVFCWFRKPWLCHNSHY